MKKKNQRQQQREKLERLLRTAALTVHPSGALSKLAEKALLSTETLRLGIRQCRFTVGAASALEAAVGRDVLRREDLCPEISKAK